MGLYPLRPITYFCTALRPLFPYSFAEPEARTSSRRSGFSVAPPRSPGRPRAAAAGAQEPGHRTRRGSIG
eukprot:3707425-Prymnesium_polylepis.1